ncbi:MAG: hypothetical protein ACP5HU_11015 [Phycisphaerae bacterium]
MSYDPSWTNGDTGGRLTACEHFVRLSDADELAEAVNRRRLLTYQWPQDFSSDVSAAARVRARTVATAVAPAYDSFRKSLSEEVLHPPAGTLGGTPASPQEMVWLWPEADGDEDKLLVASTPAAGEVALFGKLNGSDDWIDPTLMPGVSPIRAVHFNELRQATEWIRRGRWTLPLYPSAGLFSPMPDTPWPGGEVANNGLDELQTLGFAILRTEETPPRGLIDVTVRAGSSVQLLTDTDCTLELYHCLRPIDFNDDLPTWNEYAPGYPWSQPGGLGAGDSTYIGSVALSAGVAGTLSNPALTAALQAMIDGDEQNLLIRRQDNGPETTEVTALLVVEFDLNAPPN